MVVSYHLYFEQRKGKHIKSYVFEKMAAKIFNDALPDLCESELTTYSKLIGMFEEQRLSSWRKMLNIDKEYELDWHLRKYYHRELPSMTRMRYLDFKTYLPGDILTKVDRASMRVSLEARVPFLDRELVEYVFSLAADECYYNGELKTLLKVAYEDALPKDILYRKKKGFSVPNAYITQGSDTKYSFILKQEWKELVSDVKSGKKEKIYNHN